MTSDTKSSFDQATLTASTHTPPASSNGSTLAGLGMSSRCAGSSAVDCAHGIPINLICGACAAESPLESDPTGANPHRPGAKLDAGKAPIMRGVIEYFPHALCAVAEVSAFGAEKYTWGGWRSVPDGAARYGDALARHLTKEFTEGERDSDSGLPHAAHAAWNALARLELLIATLEGEG